MRRLSWYALAMMFLAWSAGSVGRADGPGVSPGPPRRPGSHAAARPTRRSRPPARPTSCWSAGSTRSGLRNWAGAIEVYREALERWPSRVEFSRRLRLCEIHFKLPSALLRHQLPQRPARPAATPRPPSSTTRWSSASSPITWMTWPSSPWSATASTISRSPCVTRSSSRPTRRRAEAERVTWLREILQAVPQGPRHPRPHSGDPHGPDLQRGRPRGDRPGGDARPARIHLRRLRRARRFHQLPHARQAGRPVRHDRRQFRRPGHRAQARQGGAAARRRDPRRSGVGGGPPARRHDRQGQRRLDQGHGPRRVRQPAPGRRGEHHRAGRQEEGRQRAGPPPASADTSRSRASPKAKIVDPAAGDRLSRGSSASRSRRPRRSMPRSRRSRAGACRSSCWTCAATPAAS